MPPVEIASPPQAATLPPRLSTAVRPGAVILGAAVALASIAAIAAAGASPYPALAAAAAIFAARGLADYRGARRILPVGLLVLALGVAGLIFLPAVRVLAEILSGVGAGILLPVATALIVSPDPRENAATPTPRVALPRRYVVPVAGRGAHRLAILLASASGGILAVASVAAPAAWWAPVVAGVAATVLVSVAVRSEFSAADPTGRAEASGAVLLPAAVVFGLSVAAAAVTGALLPGTGMIAAAVVAVLGVLAALGDAGRSRPEQFATSGRTYKTAVKSFDATVPLDPKQALTARSASEVQSAVRAARAAGLGIRAFSTGHASSTVNPVSGSALIKVLVDERVTVDEQRRTARIPAGTPWGDVVRAIAPLSLGAPHGSSSLVGAIGYLLRGGLSAYGRTTGLAVNSVESIEVVLADGELVVADRDNHADLYWALRGGGGGFGVVTAVTIRLFDLPRVVTGTTIWTLDRADELAAHWDAWRRTAPRDITTTLRVLEFPPFPGLPRAIVGKPALVIDGSVVATTVNDVDAASSIALDLLSGLRGIATPLVDSWKVASSLETAHTHMDPPMAPPHTADHFLLETTGPEAVEALLSAARSDDSKVSSMELRQLGGALAEPAADGGAVSHLRGDLAYWGVGMHSKKVSREEIVDRLDGVRESLSPWDSGFSAPSFAPDPSRPQRTLDAPTARRVADIRKQYDPEGVFGGDVAAGAVTR